MSETKIIIPSGIFDDRNSVNGNENFSPQQEIIVSGKELGRINVESLGQYVFSILGDISKPGGLDLIMTDADGTHSIAISITKNLDNGYQISSSNIKIIAEQMSEHKDELSRIVETYLAELKGFGVSV